MNTYLNASTAILTCVNAMPDDGTKHQNMQRDYVYSLMAAHIIQDRIL